MRTIQTLFLVELADKATGKVVETITTTPEHPFYIAGKGFTAAINLAIGNAIVTRAGPPLIVRSLTPQSHPEGVPVYNFEVEDDHTYFVGTVNGGTWVHNTCWTSRAGLIYEAGSAEGNRVAHLFAHLEADATKPNHTIFNVDTSHELIDLVDEAWLKHGSHVPNDPGAYIVPMGRVVGAGGQTNIKVVVIPGTSRFITAYPVR